MEPFIAQSGWVCPKCQSIWAPFQPSCFNCNKEIKLSENTTGTDQRSSLQKRIDYDQRNKDSQEQVNWNIPGLPKRIQIESETKMELINNIMDDLSARYPKRTTFGSQDIKDAMEFNINHGYIIVKDIQFFDDTKPKNRP